MKKLLPTLVLIILSAPILIAQSFVSPVSEFQPSNDCIMELTDGTEIKGKVSMVTIINGNVSAVTLKDAEGIKHKYKADKIKQFKVKMGMMAKMEAASNASGSIMEMVNADFNEIVNREYIIYQQALLPKKKDKFRLLQLVNPGFDSRIQVYYNPGGKETKGIAGITGGKDKSYLVVVDGKKSMEVEKKSYKKEFPIVFAGCKVFSENFDSKKPDFWDFASHVFAYDQLCAK